MIELIQQIQGAMDGTVNDPEAWVPMRRGQLEITLQALIAAHRSLLAIDSALLEVGRFYEASRQPVAALPDPLTPPRNAASQPVAARTATKKRGGHRHDKALSNTLHSTSIPFIFDAEQQPWVTDLESGAIAWRHVPFGMAKSLFASVVRQISQHHPQFNSNTYNRYRPEWMKKADAIVPRFHTPWQELMAEIFAVPPDQQSSPAPTPAPTPAPPATPTRSAT